MNGPRGAHGCKHWPQLSPCSHGRCCSKCRAVVCPDELPEPCLFPTTIGELFTNAQIETMRKLRAAAPKGGPQ